MSDEQETVGQARLRQVIRDVLDELDDVPDPLTLAQLVVKRQGPAERIAGYTALLYRFVEDVVRTRRNDVASRPVPIAAVAAPGPSRVDAVRSWWARQLEQRIAVGAEWKFVRDLSRSDVAAIAEARRKSADEHYATALRFERLLAAMEAADAETLSDLPEDAAASAWKAEEAA